MKKYLLPLQGEFYKANLHMHTTVSDGKFTPEETKKAYMEQGYSIVAFTDHEVMVPHTDLTDENFLAITGVEYSVGKSDVLPWVYGGTPVYHFNLYAKEPQRCASSVFSERFIVFKNSKAYVTDEMRKFDDARVYSQEYINDAIRRANEEGFLVSYNHPVWSLQSYPDYCDLKGVWGIEVYNTGCARSGFVDTVRPLDDLLKQGRQVFPLATDDSHNDTDRFGGWTMIKADRLEYSSIMRALEKGDFYASCGPKIQELYIEDGILKIACSNAAQITLTTQRRYAKAIFAKNGEWLQGAEFDMREHLERCEKVVEVTGEKPYVRITVQDERGNQAWTRAYFFEELV